MCVLKKEIKKYNKYFIEIEEDELQSNGFEDIRDIVIISKKEYERELHKLKELMTKLESRNLEIKLQSLKIQEKELEVQKATSRRKEVEESYAYKLDDFKKGYANELEELKNLLKIRESEIEKIKNELEKENQYLFSKLEGEENLKKQVELYKVGNKGLKNDIKSKEEELKKLKISYDDVLQINSGYEKEIERYKVDLDRLKNLQREHNELILNYSHFQEMINKKDQNIIELMAKTKKLEHYLLMSLDAIDNLKNLGLFKRLFNRVPEGVNELERDIKRLQPPEELEMETVMINKNIDEGEEDLKRLAPSKETETESIKVNEDINEEVERVQPLEEFEIEPVRVNKPSDVLGEKET